MNGADYPTLQEDGFNIPFPTNINASWYAWSQLVSKQSFTVENLTFSWLVDFSNVTYTTDLTNDGLYHIPSDFVVFLGDDTVTWQGHEAGFLILANGTIYAYVQNGAIWAHYDNLGVNDNLNHTYAITISTVINFYIDGTLSTTIDPPDLDFNGFHYQLTIVGHRYQNGWDSNQSYSIINNIVINGEVHVTPQTPPMYATSEFWGSVMALAIIAIFVKKLT